MRAFVAGATGYTGREVVRELRDRGVAVSAHVRPDSANLAQWQERFEKLNASIDTTPWQPAALRSSLLRLQPTLVFALLGTTRARARAAAERGIDASYQAVDYGMTAMLLQATSQAKFIYLSSLGVSARTRNPYLAVRWRLESELRASGLPYIIARPALVTGSDRAEFRMGERVAAVLSDALLNAAALVGVRAPRERFAALSGRQLARALVSAALNHDCRNVILEAAQLRALGKP